MRILLISCFSFILILCSIPLFSVPYWNRTFFTHAVPNIFDFIGYVFDGRPTDNPPKIPGVDENGVRFAKFESFIDRLLRNDDIEKYTYIPPKLLTKAIDKGDFDMNPELFHKFDSVPNILRDVALPRLSSHRRNVSTGVSIFTTNLEDRGFDKDGGNLKKRQYMDGLKMSNIQDYVSRCSASMEKAIQCMINGDLPHLCIFEAVKDITFIIHTHNLPEKIDKEFIESGADAFSAVSEVYKLDEVLFMPWATQKHILKHDNYIDRLKNKLKDGTFKGLFKSLKDNGYNEADIVVEYLHNVLAMTLQWTILMEELVMDSKSKTDATDEYIYNHLKKKPTAAFVISSLNKNGKMPSNRSAPTHLTHALQEMMSNYPNPVNLNNRKVCPFAKNFIKSAEGAVIMQSTKIIEEKGNWGFGKGYRRCAGEVLTLEIMKSWIIKIHERNFEYVREEEPIGTFGFAYKYRSTFKLI